MQAGKFEHISSCFDLRTLVSFVEQMKIVDFGYSSVSAVVSKRLLSPRSLSVSEGEGEVLFLTFLHYTECNCMHLEG